MGPPTRPEPTAGKYIGPALAQTIFDKGRRRALTDEAIAAYDAVAAPYTPASNFNPRAGSDSFRFSPTTLSSALQMPPGG